MLKTRTQLNALIRNKAAGDGDKAQILLRIYMMERLLERISVSEYRDNFILKGGMLVFPLWRVKNEIIREKKQAFYCFDGCNAGFLSLGSCANPIHT
jgi:hypothetical protein